jgi:transmembrane protein 132
LAVADADVFVKIQTQKSDPINDFDSKMTDKNNNDNLSNIALQDDQSYIGKPVVSNGRLDSTGTRGSSSTNRDRFQNNRIHPHQMTPLEVGMYILLAVFCAAMAIFVASCFVYASKYRRQDFPLQSKSQSVQNAHDWVWLGKSNNSSKQSVEGGSQTRMSFAGSEMNITANPRPEDFAIEEQQQQLVGTNSTSSRSRTRTMASGHLPPPGHPAHGAPPFQIAPELIRYGPYQKSHRYHQQMLMHNRPQRFLPATPINQRLSPVYQNNNNMNNMMISGDRFEIEQLQQQQRLMELERKQEEQLRMLYQEELSLARRFASDASTNVIQNPMMEEEDQLDCQDIEESQQVRRPKIDTSTYTKKNVGLTYFDDEHDRGRLILPVGYPYYGGNSSPKVSFKLTAWKLIDLFISKKCFYHNLLQTTHC